MTREQWEQSLRDDPEGAKTSQHLFNASGDERCLELLRNIRAAVEQYAGIAVDYRDVYPPVNIEVEIYNTVNGALRDSGFGSDRVGRRSLPDAEFNASAWPEIIS